MSETQPHSPSCVFLSKAAFSGKGTFFPDLHILRAPLLVISDFLDGAGGPESSCQDPRDRARSSGREDLLEWVASGNPLQHSCLENSMDRGAWLATVQGVAKSQIKLVD